MTDKKLKLLALSGSLRKLSYNTAAINALKVLAADQVDITIGNIGELPLFNPDLEDGYIPSFEALRLALSESDGLIISSPEYAHGISGSLKNALDWLVSSSEFPDIPIMLVNTSPRASHAQLALREVVTTMSGTVIEDACISVPLLGSELDAEGIVEHHDISKLMRTGLEIFCSKIT